MHHGHHLVAPFHPVAGRFVAEGEEGERWMIAIFVSDSLALANEIVVNEFTPAQLHTVVWP